VTQAFSRPRPEARSRAGPRRILVCLCVTEITSYGVLYYAFPVMATEISADTGWSTVAITAGFSAAQLIAALVGIPVGRHLDRHGPRVVMTAGSALAAVATVAIALAPTLPVFIAAWLPAGVAMGAVFYPPAFTALTRWYGARRVQALTWLTLAAGLASTVFAPLTAYLMEHSGWRTTYLILAATLAVITAPAHWWGLRASWPEAPSEASPHESAHEPSRIARSLPFAAVTIALSLASFAAFAAVINLVPLLLERGLTTSTAALALGLGGAGQVAGRLAYPLLSKHLEVRTRTALILAMTALTIAMLGLLTSANVLIVASIGAGIARGLLTLVQATAVSDRWGTRHYGRLTGLLSAPVTVSIALAPGAGAAIADLTGGYGPAFMVIAGVGAAGAAITLAPHRLTGARSTPRATEPCSHRGGR
jgi:MFS family permease